VKGLIIDEPWIGLILSGEKTWEMRKTACHNRGLIAFIRKGSGHVVGVVEIVDSLPPIDSTSDYAKAEQSHRIPPSRQTGAFSSGWRTPWVLQNARPLADPVSYEHPYGAVIWVNLHGDVKSAIAAQSALPSGQETLIERSTDGPTKLWTNHMQAGLSRALADPLRTMRILGETSGPERASIIATRRPNSTSTINGSSERNGLHAVVQRGKAVGTILIPHIHADGCYVVSTSRYEKDYVRLQLVEDVKEHLRRGYSLRMSNPEQPNHKAPSLITSASVIGWQ
jgi:hypothetical protein